MTSITRTSGQYARRAVGLPAALITVVALLAPGTALGQGTGLVQGTVVDEANGAPLANAVVTLEELGLSDTTGADGAFSIPQVPAGGYTVSVLRDGYAPLVTPVTVTAGGALTLDLQVPTAAFEEEVQVTGVFSELDLREETAIGSRLPLPAMDVPASIGIIDSTAIARRGYLRLSDVMEGMAGVIVGQFPAEPTSFSMRGFTRSQITVLRDNIWLGPANMTMRRQNTFNLDRVELLRGPSSVINGQGAVAGTVNTVTKQAQPTATTDVSSLLSYGQFNTYQAAVGVNGPASDTVFYPKFTNPKTNLLQVKGLRRQEFPSGTTNVHQTGEGGGQTTVLRTPPGWGSTPSAS